MPAETLRPSPAWTEHGSAALTFPSRRPALPGTSTWQPDRSASSPSLEARCSTSRYPTVDSSLSPEAFLFSPPKEKSSVRSASAEAPSRMTTLWPLPVQQLSPQRVQQLDCRQGSCRETHG